jgi:hypothetical protein
VVAVTTTTPDPVAGELVPVADPLFTAGERQALAGFLSGYSGLTRDASPLDLRQYTGWCTVHGLHLFAARRIDIESFRGEMEAHGRARAHDRSDERVFVTMYGLTLLAIRLLGATLDVYAQHEHLYSAHAYDQELTTDRRKRLSFIIACLVVILIGLALPELAVAL